nr:hypothetical protein BaRGS_002784 [Batillaria attramentaria]
MTLEQYELTDTIVHCVLNPILLLVGAPTNIISCLVFYKQVFDEAGEIHYQIIVTDFFIKHHTFYAIFYEIFLSFVVPIVNFVVVGVATAITVIKLRTAIAWRASTSSGMGDNHSQQQQAALTKMLVMLSCVFMVCSAPLTSLTIVRLFVPDYSLFGRYSNFFYASHAVGIHIVLINSSINFFVYYFRSSRFKQELNSMFCRNETKVGEHTKSSDTKYMQ